MNFEDFLAAPSEKQKTAQLAAGMNFFASLRQPLQKTAAAGLSQRSASAVAAIAGAGNSGVSPVTEGSGKGFTIDLPGTSVKADSTTGFQANPAGGRSSQLSTRPGDTVLNTKLPGKPSLGKPTGKGGQVKKASLDALVKEAFVGELWRSLAAGGRGAKAMGGRIAAGLDVEAKGLADGARGFRTASGREVKQHGDRLYGKGMNALNDFADKFRSPHALDARDKAIAEGTYRRGLLGRVKTSDDAARQLDHREGHGGRYYNAYARGKNADGDYGTSDLFDKVNKTFRNPDSSFSVLSVADGLHRSGMLRKNSISDAVEGSGKYVSKMPEEYRADARKKMLMAGAGAAAGAGVGGFALSKYMSRKKERDDSDS